jgi:hypothetical protein
VANLRFEDVDFHFVNAFRDGRQCERIGLNRAGRLDSRALEQAANHCRFREAFRSVRYHDSFRRTLLTHLTLFASTIAPISGKVHTNSSGIHRPMTEDGKSSFPSQEEIDEESRRIRRLRILVHLTLESIAGGDLSPEEASGMIAATRRVALEMFPGKERAFDLIYRPKFQRVMHAVYRLQ